MAFSFDLGINTSCVYNLRFFSLQHYYIEWRITSYYYCIWAVQYKTQYRWLAKYQIMFFTQNEAVPSTASYWPCIALFIIQMTAVDDSQIWVVWQAFLWQRSWAVEDVEDTPNSRSRSLLKGILRPNGGLEAKCVCVLLGSVFIQSHPCTSIH